MATFVSVDIEKTGSFLIQNPVISVGFFVGDDQGNKLLTKKFNMQVKFPVKDDYGDFEPRCWDEFWSKLDQKIIEASTENAQPQETAWKAVNAFLDELEAKYDKIKFLTDNASFDIASIDYNLEKYCKRAPMRYNSKGKYRSVISADDMLDMLPEKELKLAYEYINANSKHDHDPVNDAHNIYLQYIQAIKYKNSK